MADSPNPHDQALEKAASGEIPGIYFNGFSTGFSNADITTVLMINGQPAAVVNMSFTLAKTLSQSLGQAVAQLEERADTKILTTHDIDEKYAVMKKPGEAAVAAASKKAK